MSNKQVSVRPSVDDERHRSPGILAEIDERHEQNRREAERLRREQEALDQQQQKVKSHQDTLEDQIESLLSANPEEFVIRFLQTEGQ